jgi:tetratricopeptide (TPR) repeat protein
MKLASKLLAVLCLLPLLCSTALACLWDHDTLAMERLHFPGTLELITGKFLRHSPKFYQWRIENRGKRLPTESTPELYDDLAVAYEKTGNHDKAIELMVKKEELFPGLYETRANLGTFYMLGGQFEKGVEEIEKAIAINPDAHFGREVYQKHLGKYVLARQAERMLSPTNPLQLPLNTPDHRYVKPVGFAEYLVKSQNLGESLKVQTPELAKALKGVSGMMYFANYDSPVLLEVLGDLLLTGTDRGDAKQLAARAYLKASYEVKDADAKSDYRRMAEESLAMQTTHIAGSDQLTLAALEEEFKSELQDAQAWHAGVAADEQKWIDEGVDADAAFDKKYYAAPNVKYPVSVRTWEWEIVIGVGVLVALLVGLGVWRKLRPVRQTTIADPE